MLPETIRRDMKSVEISLSSEVFLCRLFGKPMNYIHGKKRQKTWKKVLVRIVSVLQKAIQNNLESDGFHKSQINHHLEKLQKACKSRYNTEPEIILSLTGIILELLGGAPNYTGRCGLNRKSDYFLNNLRTAQYLQTPYQKVCTIFESSRYMPHCNQHKYDDLFQVYVTQYNGDPKGFLQWYKDKYPQVYLELF